MNITVKVYQLSITVNGKEKTMTKALAKQFPIDFEAGRSNAAMRGKPQPEPICKINGKTLGTDRTWLYLVEDETAGLKWVVPALFKEGFAASVIERGGWADNPADVPTVTV